MGRCHQKLFYIVVIDSAHTLDSLAASVLTAEIINGHTFDIS